MHTDLNFHTMVYIVPYNAKLLSGFGQYAVFWLWILSTKSTSSGILIHVHHCLLGCPGIHFTRVAT